MFKKIESGGGFTLLEVLVALVILGIALLPLMTAEMNAQGAYITLNAITKETILARNIMSRITYNTVNVFPLDKKGEVKSDKKFEYTEKIKTTGFPGIFMVEINVFEKGNSPGSGVVLKSLSR